jgi:hypothetical protein
MMRKMFRCLAVGLMTAMLVLSGTASSRADEAVTGDLKARFDYLSTHGNSNCSTAFLQSIPAMPATARLQGSCCSPMDAGRYAHQIAGLKKYASFQEIPTDPYNVPAGLAGKLLAAYEQVLTPAEQKAYDAAMRTSAEHGPCCCECWRWHVYGGLAKILIHDHGFTGTQVAEVWNLSDGCGGTSD